MAAIKIYLDTETTGLEGPRVVEIAWAVEGGEVQVLRCRPAKPIELDATVVNGIRNKDVEHLPLFNELPEYPTLKALLEDAIVIAHNASFDIGVLKNEGIIVHNFIDTKTLAMKKWPSAPKHRLQHLRYWLDIDIEGEAHTAAGDVMVLRELWKHLNEQPSRSPSPARVKDSEINLDSAPREMRREQLRKRIAGRKLPPRRAG